MVLGPEGLPLLLALEVVQQVGGVSGSEIVGVLALVQSRM
jgi:hypothetical protein